MGRADLGWIKLQSRRKQLCSLQWINVYAGNITVSGDIHISGDI